MYCHVFFGPQCTFIHVWLHTVAGSRRGHVFTGSRVISSDRAHRRATRRRVGRLVRRASEEVMLQCVVRRDARHRIIVQHTLNQVLELHVVLARMTRLPTPPAAWPSDLTAQQLM